MEVGPRRKLIRNCSKLINAIQFFYSSCFRQWCIIQFWPIICKRISDQRIKMSFKEDLLQLTNVIHSVKMPKLLQTSGDSECEA